MTGAEKIQNNKLFRIMEQLRQNNTMLSMRLVGQNYQRLTMITHIFQDKDRSFFVIDQPRDFKRTVSELGTWEIHFNFRGPDNLEYIFNTLGGKFFDGEPQIPFPKYIERLQRRRHFRMSVPSGTKLYFDFEQVRHEIDLMNISMGGSLGLLKTSTDRDHNKLILQKDDDLKNIEIVFPCDTNNSRQKLNINKGIVRRAEYDPKRKIDIYAFEFENMDKNQEKMLIEFIFNLQRSFLRSK